jgi:hypothetical protein
MAETRRVPTLLLGALVLAAGCAPARPADTSTGATIGAASTRAPCPVTIPDGRFAPPDGYPGAPSRLATGHRWYGSDRLWTVLPVDGGHGERKSVWWSTAFPGGDEEERPPIAVTWTRLDDPDTEPHTQAEGTNAYTVADGWFMIAGIDPDESGCWEVTASYKGATLSYVYERP